MTITVKQPEKSLTREQIIAVEERLHIVLPTSYKDFLLQYNGGRPSPNFFTFTKNNGGVSDSCIDWFLAIYDGEFDNFESYFDTYKVHQARIPPELVPIAHDPGGNLVCISVSGDNKGAIYFWDHENEATTDNAPSYENVHLIASSFDEFLGSIKRGQD